MCKNLRFGELIRRLAPGVRSRWRPEDGASTLSITVMCRPLTSRPSEVPQGCTASTTYRCPHRERRRRLA